LPDRRIRILHAACSSGEEPYSMVMHLIRTGWTDRVEIDAFDGDVAALERARLGDYSTRSFRSFVPILIVLHMPEGYTAAYAERLDAACPLPVREAADGLPMVAGMVVIARAGRHLTLVRTPEGVVARLTTEPANQPHRPSADVLFRSASEIRSFVAGSTSAGMKTRQQERDG
jgi:hypothetical protein